MQPLFWLEEGELAGSRGPAGQNWDLDELQRSGIGAILSLAENVAADWPQSPFEFAVSLCRVEKPRWMPIYGSVSSSCPRRSTLSSASVQPG